jgi:hypothetical protein
MSSLETCVLNLICQNESVFLSFLHFQHTLLEEFYNAEEVNIDNIPVSASPLITSTGTLQILSPSAQLTPTKGRGFFVLFCCRTNLSI